MREGKEKGSGKGSKGRGEVTREGPGSSFTPDEKYDFSLHADGGQVDLNVWCFFRVCYK